MRYVGDMDLKFVVTVGERGYVDGVVKIARGFAVDRDDGKISKIAPAVEIGLGYGLRGGLGFGDGIFREYVRQMMLADDDFDVDADFAGAA